MEEQKNPGEAKNQAERDKITGVFSTQTVATVGTGTTKRKTIQKTYWYAKQVNENTVEVQPLNVNYVPSGPKRNIPKNEFLDKFSPEPEFYTQTVYPKLKELNKTIARADRHRTRGEHFSAEYEYGNALKVDEENIRANFGLGLTYLDREQTDKANDIFERLVTLDAAFDKEHKHLFNDFGINLRKNKMLDQSLEYYSKALSLSQNDENLHYNIARVYYEKNQMDKAIEHLKKALELNPEHEEANKFLEFIQEKRA